jgi:hypothetical protein
MEVLHGDEPRARVLAELVHVAHVLVDQLRGELGLVAKHRDEVIVFSEVRKDPLENDQVLAVSTSGRTREKDLRHATSRELRDQLIAAEISGVAWDQCPRRNRHDAYYARTISRV